MPGAVAGSKLAMPLPIEDYALIGNCRTAALVGRDGSIDWLCLPRFDSPACFAALLGTRDNGRWLLAPENGNARVERRYRRDTLVLETEFHTEAGRVRIVDCMPTWDGRCELVRVVEGLAGRVPMKMELVLRFGYGSVAPWVRRVDGSLHATAGPDSVRLRAGVPTHGEDLRTVATFTVEAGQRVPFVLTHFASHEPAPLPVDPGAAVEEAERRWRSWCALSTYRGEWRDAVTTSLIVLKALTYSPTGGMVAAPTASLPEHIGQGRNWDYRYCWLRDATFTLYALLGAGYRKEAAAWREWLLRAASGEPRDLRVLYGVAGERDLPERTLDWLPGFEGSRPVRIGNAAALQRQLDVYGEVLDMLHVGRAVGLEIDEASWGLQVALLEYLESNWAQPDRGIWEMRAGPRHFTHSKMMAWVAFDRAVHAVERSRLAGPAERWRGLRDRIHAEICERAYDAELGTFVQYYGARRTDASLLLAPLVGFLPANDPRMLGTIAAVERELLVDGLVRRYDAESGVDGLPAGEGAFLPCTFWLADCHALAGHKDRAGVLFERLLSLRNDVGLLAEEYDPHARRQLGNFPQAFSHVGLVNTAANLSAHDGPGRHRSRRHRHAPAGSRGAR